MSEQPSFLPFVTSITTDIYERIEKISKNLEEIKTSIEENIANINENMGTVVKKIEELIEQGEMNKTTILKSFGGSMDSLIQQIKTIQNENITAFAGNPETPQLIESANLTVNQLSARLYDIQIAFLINGIHALITAIKTGKVVGIPIPVKGGSATAPMPGKQGGENAELAAPIPALSSETEKSKTSFGKGVRKKTHDEIMEEKRKQKEMFGKYAK
jgi:hypothetical protein